jgi:hypothetical protein
MPVTRLMYQLLAGAKIVYLKVLQEHTGYKVATRERLSVATAVEQTFSETAEIPPTTLPAMRHAPVIKSGQLDAHLRRGLVRRRLGVEVLQARKGGKRAARGSEPAAMRRILAWSRPSGT